MNRLPASTKPTIKTVIIGFEFFFLSFNKCFIDMMIDKILASSFLDFVATYRLHLWNRKKTKILRSHSGKAVLLSAGAMYS